MRTRKTMILLTIFMCGVAIFWGILYPDKASSGPYLDSAHGNYTPAPGYGVLRTSLSTPPNDYGRGNCAHCHEQHASVGGAEPNPTGGAPSKYELFRDLFTSQASMFCFSCHGTETSVQTLPAQYNYSRIAGGDSNTCPADIMDAFQFVNTTGTPQSNCGSSSGSSHFLADIRTLLTNKGSTWNFSSTAEDNDPCSGCHNPHRAQRDPHTSTGRIIDGKLVSSVSRPSQHSKDNNAWGLWGDDPATERMSNYNYQPPYRYNSTTTYEPDGYNVSDASRTVDYVAFCTDCHNASNTISSTTLTRNLLTINWGFDGDKMGQNHESGVGNGAQNLDGAPYNDDTQYVLSCTDCHEPHGSTNIFLLRTRINGKTTAVTVTDTSDASWTSMCTGKCHSGIRAGTCTGDTCYNCHKHGSAGKF